MACWELTPRGVIVDEDTFAFLMELESRQATRLNYPLSILSILPSFADGSERSEGGEIDRRLGEILSARVRGTDVVQLPSTPSGPLRVCLVGADLEDLPGVIGRLIEELGAHRFDIDGRPETLRYSIGGSSLPATADRPSALMGEADSFAVEAHRDGATYRLPDRHR